MFSLVNKHEEFFDFLVTNGEYFHKGTLMVKEVLQDPKKLERCAKEAEKIEHLADGVTHEVAAKMKHLSREEAEGFYAVHKERPFFQDLVNFMISGPVMIQVLEGEDAVAKNRELMGATNPKEAAAGTIRADFAESVGENAVHGSDSLENAALEIAYFFTEAEICPR